LSEHKNHIKIGITGGIGVGKTTVCNIFRQLQIPIYDADTRAKFLMNHSKDLQETISKNFGWESYDRKNNLNREYLAKVVFSNPDKLSLLNSIVHPRVNQDYNEWVLEHSNYPYSVKEAALLFESGSYKNLHKTIVVTCPINIRIERIMNRDRVRREDVLKRIDNQMTDRERLALADYKILNDGKNSLIEQVLKFHKIVLEMSKNPNQNTLP
jgi:dephospho-CoA kinase